MEQIHVLCVAEAVVRSQKLEEGQRSSRCVLQGAGGSADYMTERGLNDKLG